MSNFLSGSKCYRVIAKLGTATDTLDSTGNITSSCDCSQISLEKLDMHLSEFRGDIMQLPPMYSALKHNGKRLYQLAREGVEVERELRPVTVYNIRLLPISEPLPYFGLEVESSGGFYVRSLVSDLAISCGGLAHMTELVRTKQGMFTLADCLPQESWNFDCLLGNLEHCSKVADIDVTSLKPAVL
jgi:tRNA pseudouridine55 synthase